MTVGPVAPVDGGVRVDGGAFDQRQRLGAGVRVAVGRGHDGTHGRHAFWDATVVDSATIVQRLAGGRAVVYCG